MIFLLRFFTWGIFALPIALLTQLIARIDFDELETPSAFVTATRRIILEEFPHAYNPSLVQYRDGYLMTFRYTPDMEDASWVSYIGIVYLDDNFNPLSQPQLLNTRSAASITPSQAEDARLFVYKKRLFLLYNDNREVEHPQYTDRRDMFMAELFEDKGQFRLSPPLKLVYEPVLHSQLWQKNWVPFEWDKKLLCAYTINPHEILGINLLNGSCYQYADTWQQIDWKWGLLRGSTPPQLVNGEYLGFFHSSLLGLSPYTSAGYDLWHYFMGAYTFAPDPPFQLTKLSAKPIMKEGFYVPSNWEKRVIFPGGYVVSGQTIYLAYGRNDCEMWIATLNLEALMRSLKPL